MSKPNPIAVSEPFSLLPPYGKYKCYRIEWYDKSKRQTVGLSTGTTDLEAAKKLFFKHCLENTAGTATEDAVKDEPAATALARYYVQYAQKLASEATARTAMNSANEQFKELLVSQVGAGAQQSWITSLRRAGIADNTITRWLGVVFAAFNYAVTFKHITPGCVPARLPKRHWGPRDTPRKRPDGDASRRELTPQELGKICDTTEGRPNGLRYFICALGSAGRPIALVNLTQAQYDEEHGVLDLNPVGHIQNDKYHARIPVAPIFRQWLDSWTPLTASGHYMARRGKIIASKDFFKKYIAESGVPDCVPYTLRHTVASWLAGHGIPKWSRSRFLGHMRPDGNTTDEYSHCDPSYLRDAAAAVQKLFEAIAPFTKVDLMRHQWTDQTLADESISQWTGFFLGQHGLRLMSPPAPRILVSTDPDMPTATPPVACDAMAPASSYAALEVAEGARKEPDIDPCVARAWRESLSAEKTPLESMGRLGLEPRTNTLKGSQEDDKSHQNQIVTT